MTKFVAPNEGEGKKAYLRRAYGIGNGPARGRISREGHEKLNEAVSKGYSFPEAVIVSKVTRATPKAPKVEKPAAPEGAKALDPKKVRKWARDNGFTVGDRGRIGPGILSAYMNAVPAEQRETKSDMDPGNWKPAPRVYPEGTKFLLEFKYRGKDTTLTVGDRTACGNCRWSLGWCKCSAPYVATGYGDNQPRVTPIMPKGYTNA